MIATPDAGVRPEEFDRSIIAATPTLRRQVRSLCRDPALVEDLIQETVLKALANHDKFEPNSNLGAWLYTIARNAFFGIQRKLKREVEDVDGTFSEQVATPGAQEDHVLLGQVLAAINRLPQSARASVRLVMLFGLNYDEAALRENVPVGTVKSRVSRARAMLKDDVNLGRMSHGEREEAAQPFQRAIGSRRDGRILVPLPSSDPVHDRIGDPPRSGDKEAIAHAPSNRRRPGRRSRFDLDEIRRLAKNMSKREVAKRVGCPYHVVIAATRGTRSVRPAKEEASRPLVGAVDASVVLLLRRLMEAQRASLQSEISMHKARLSDLHRNIEALDDSLELLDGASRDQTNSKKMTDTSVIPLASIREVG